MADPKGNPSFGDASEREEATMVAHPPDPGIGRLQQELSEENLPSMRLLLARCRVEHIAASKAFDGFNYQGFVQNLRGMGKMELGGTRLYTLLTRHNAFLLSNLVAEQLYDLVKGFMSLDLSNRATLRDGDRRRFLYWLPAGQVEKLRLWANQNRIHATAGFPFASLAQFKNQLRICRTDSEGFDLARFSQSVKSVSNFYEDHLGTKYHQVVAGELEYRYLLYVSPPRPPAGAVLLRFGATVLALARD